MDHSYLCYPLTLKQYFHQIFESDHKLEIDHKPSHLSSSSQRCFEMKAHCDYYDYHDIEREFEVAVNRGQIYNTDQQRSHQNVIGDTNISQSNCRNF